MPTLLRFVPGALIRWAGRAQFRYPFTSRLINGLSQRMLSEGTIQRGHAKGLKIDATGSNPGFLTGTTEPLEQEVLVANLKPGDVFYDVGANIGFYALLGSQCVTSTGRVFAFEPTPMLCSRIRKNAAINCLMNVDVVEKAVSNHEGPIAFDIVGELSTMNRISDRTATDCDSTVEATTIDAFAITHPPPNVMLLDIEGAEIDALSGALQTIRTHRPTILVEVHWLGERFVRFVEQNLRPLGYTFCTYDGQPIPPGNMRYHALLKCS